MFELIPIMILVIVIHETGHIVTARILNLNIDKIGFSLKPFPRFYVSVITRKSTICQRIIFLISGNIATTLIFLLFLLSNLSHPILYYLLAIQIVVETNPVYSDYVVAIMSYLFRKKYDRYYYLARHGINDDEIINPQKLKEIYIFSSIWYIHFILWGALIITLFSPNCLIQLIN